MKTPQHNTNSALVARLATLALVCAFGAGEASAQGVVSAPVEVQVATACGGARGRARLVEELRLRVEGLRTVEPDASAQDALTRWVVRWAQDARGDCVMTLADERSVVVVLPLKADSPASALGEATVRVAWFVSTIEPRQAPAPVLAPPREPFSAPQDEPQNPEAPVAVAASTSAEQTSRQGSTAVDTAGQDGPPKRGEPTAPAQKPKASKGFWGGLGTRIGGFFDQTARTTRRIGAGASRTAAAIERRGAPTDELDSTLLKLNASLSTSARQGASGDPMWFVGARLGAVIHDSFGLGLVYQKMISDNRVSWDAYDTGEEGSVGSFKTAMDLNLLGVDMEYILFPHNRVYAVFNVMAGAGIVEYQSSRVEENDRLASMLIVDTSAQVMVKIDTWFEIGAGFGFRGATVYPTLGARSADFTGFSGMLTLRMPVF